MKNGNSIQKLKEAKKNERRSMANYREIQQRMNEEIEDATLFIKMKYGEALDKASREFDQAFDASYSSLQEYIEYSGFVAEYFMPCMEIFISYIEGERFIHCYDYNGEEKNILARLSKIPSRANIYLTPSQLKELLLSGDALVIGKGMYFRHVDFCNYFGQPTCRLGRFTYLNEFINRLIKYREDNDLKGYASMNREEIYAYMSKYLASHPELVEMNKDKREKMLSEGLDKHTRGCIRLELLQKNMEEQ